VPELVEEYQTRVRAEREDLASKLVKLRAFIGGIQRGKVFATLPPAEQALLVRQSDAMERYLEILDMRVSLWEP
jgi:hypothetical protein